MIGGPIYWLPQSAVRSAMIRSHRSGIAGIHGTLSAPTSAGAKRANRLQMLVAGDFKTLDRPKRCCARNHFDHG